MTEKKNFCNVIKGKVPLNYSAEQKTIDSTMDMKARERLNK